MLRPQTMMLAILAREPSWPTRRMPQVGFTPTGAEAASADTPWRMLELWFSICAIVSVRACLERARRCTWW